MTRQVGYGACINMANKKLTEKERLAIYDILRVAHKSLPYSDSPNLNNHQKNAIEAVSSVLYMAEGVFAVDEEDYLLSKTHIKDAIKRKFKNWEDISRIDLLRFITNLKSK